MFYSTNDKKNKVSFEKALLTGLAPDYGLYMVSRKDIPKLSDEEMQGMIGQTYPEIAFRVLRLFLKHEIRDDELRPLLQDAYDESIIPTEVQHVRDNMHMLWLTKGPTYSFKDYAARFYARTLDHFLGKKGLKRSVIVATSGDTGGAVADALHGLDNVINIVFFPKGEISERQRRQMTTLAGNVYAFEVNGDFDVCQSLAKALIGDRGYALTVTGDKDNFTSANSISLGRLLPQAVYPFYAYSKIGKEMVASVPSGNFGDMMGTVIARQIGLPISKILIGLNPNKPFMDFLENGKYEVKPSIPTPSSAMKVSHPSNLARLIDFYGGHMYDERKEGKVIREGIIGTMPDLEEMRKDFFAASITNEDHYAMMREFYKRHNIFICPHTAVGWRTAEIFGESEKPVIVYATADAGKFPDDVKKATGEIPELPEGMKRQMELAERILTIEKEPEKTEAGIRLSDDQLDEAKKKIAGIFR